MDVVIDRDEVDYETCAVGSWLVTLKGPRVALDAGIYSTRVNESEDKR